MSDNKPNPVEIEETDLDDVNGGLLLPAVQKVREAAARMTTTATPGDGSVKPGDGSVKPGDISSYEGFPC